LTTQGYTVDVAPEYVSWIVMDGSAARTDLALSEPQPFKGWNGFHLARLPNFLYAYMNTNVIPIAKQALPSGEIFQRQETIVDHDEIYPPDGQGA
jgi:hypothetical protein